MISASGIELRAGARILIENATFRVTKGDRIGYVEMLGVRHDVQAPRAGLVSHLVAESGEAVEYGQVVVEIEPEAAAR